MVTYDVDPIFRSFDDDPSSGNEGVGDGLTGELGTATADDSVIYDYRTT